MRSEQSPDTYCKFTSQPVRTIIHPLITEAYITLFEQLPTELNSMAGTQFEFFKSKPEVALSPAEEAESTRCKKKEERRKAMKEKEKKEQKEERRKQRRIDHAK